MFCSLHTHEVCTQLQLSARCKHLLSVPAAHELKEFHLLIRTSCQGGGLLDASPLQIMQCMSSGVAVAGTDQVVGQCTI